VRHRGAHAGVDERQPSLRGALDVERGAAGRRVERIVHQRHGRVELGHAELHKGAALVDGLAV
jgi:hypothetical protein